MLAQAYPMAAAGVPASNAGEDHKTIDRIIYLASLASERLKIEPMMDTLRAITASWEPTEPLSGKDRDLLNNLETKLKDYLINRDPLRAFTPETLATRLSEQQLGRRPGVDAATRALFTTLALSLAAAGSAFIIPIAGISASTRLYLTVPLFFMVLQAGIVWFYLSALPNFKREFRRAYITICAGISLLGIAFSHYALFQIFGLSEQPVFKYGGITGLVGASFILIYLGLHLYAKLLGIQSKFASWKLLLPIWIGLTLALVLAPHSAKVAEEPFYDLALAGMLPLPIFGLFGAGLARAIKRSVTSAYAKSMKWLYVYLMVAAFGSIVPEIALYFLGAFGGSLFNLISGICGIPPQLLLLYSGYSFKKETGR